MKKLSLLVSLFVLLSAISCQRASETEEELDPHEKEVQDSLSRIKQKAVNDSLKKLNPLLIIPPDSTYSGAYTDKYPDGIVKFKGTFRFGEKHGQWLSFYPNGTAWSEMHFDNGLREGPNITYYENGNIRYSGYYHIDKVDSLWSYYDSAGTLIETLLYKNEKLIKRTKSEKEK